MARRTQQDNRKLATFISLVFNPALMIFLQALILLRTYPVTPHQLLLVTMPFIVPSVLYVLIMVFILKRVDYEFTKKESRWPVLILIVLGMLVSVPLSVSITPSMTQLLLRMLVMFIIVTSVTFYWKVSLHTLFFSMTVIMLSSYVDSGLILLYILLPLIYWSRIVLHKHTPSPLLLGTLLPILIVL